MSVGSIVLSKIKISMCIGNKKPLANVVEVCNFAYNIHFNEQSVLKV